MAIPYQIETAVRHISAYAARLYVDILKRGTLHIDGNTSAADVSIAVDLEYYGFIFRQATANGYNLFPTPFEILIPSLLHRLDWQYAPFADIPDIDRSHLKTDLRSFYGSTSESVLFHLEPSSMSQTLDGAAHIDSFIVQLLEQTQDLCAVSAAEWSSNLPLVWSAIVRRMKKGMTYRRIVSPLGLAAFGLDINKRDISEIGINLRVSLVQTLSPFYIFTSAQLRATLVFVPVTHGKAEPRATYTALGQLTERLSDIFEDIWQSAVPAQFVLEQLQTYRPCYIDKARSIFGKNGAYIAESLFDKGVFASFNVDKMCLLSKLADHGFAVKSDYTIGLTAYVPNVLTEIENCIQNLAGKILP